MPAATTIRRAVALPALACLAALAGCASTPQPLQGTYSSIAPARVEPATAEGLGVRWGGMIAAVHPGEQRTCFEIVSRPLGRDARPEGGDRTGGRFLACREGFYDPEVFTEGRELTVTGTVGGFEDGRVGEYAYRYPRVDADVIYLWPVQRRLPVQVGIGVGYVHW